MRWIWKLLVVFLLLIIIFKPKLTSQPQVFISLPQSETIKEKVVWQIKHWQNLAQDLPASVETQIHRIFQDFEPNGDGQTV